MDTAIQQIGSKLPGHVATVQLTGVYHKLLRQWAEIREPDARAAQRLI